METPALAFSENWEYTPNIYDHLMRKVLDSIGMFGQV